MSRPSVVLEHLAEEFLDAPSCRDKRLATWGGRPIHASVPSTVQREARPQVALPFHTVQDGIERARAQAIAVPAELVDHRLAEDRSFSGVMKNMEPDESGIEIAIYHRTSASVFDNGVRSIRDSFSRCQRSAPCVHREDRDGPRGFGQLAIDYQIGQQAAHPQSRRWIVLRKTWRWDRHARVRHRYNVWALVMPALYALNPRRRWIGFYAGVTSVRHS